MTEVLSTFVAHDSQGGEITLIVHANLWASETIKTQDGRSVNRMEKGKYQIVGGAHLISDDPAAP